MGSNNSTCSGFGSSSGIMHTRPPHMQVYLNTLNIYIYIYLTLPNSNTLSRGVHGSGRVGFGPKPYSTRLNRFFIFGTRIRPNIGSDPIYRVFGLSGSESSVSRVWASDWAGLFDRVKITENTFFWAFLLNLFSKKAFWALQK